MKDAVFYDSFISLYSFLLEACKYLSQTFSLDVLAGDIVIVFKSGIVLLSDNSSVFQIVH